MPEYLPIAIFALLGSVFVGGAMVTSHFVASRSPDNLHKHLPYECGEEVIGTARIQFKVGYYLFALIFLIFDVESLFLFPCVQVFKKIGQGGIPHITVNVAIIEILVFVAVLALGLVYAWRKKALEWE